MAPRSSFHDRCCNPFGLTNHKKIKNLRKVTETIQRRWRLALDGRVCSTCRSELNKRDPDNYQYLRSDKNEEGSVHRSETSEPMEATNADDIDLESTATPSSSQSVPSCSQSTPSCSQSTNVSDVAIEIRLPVINRALALLDESPIPAKLMTGKQWVDYKVAKLADNLRQQLIGFSEDSFSAQKEALDLRTMIITFKEKFHQPDTTRVQKLQILGLFPSNWSIKKIAVEMDTSESMVRQSKKLVTTSGILSTPEAKLGRKLATNIKTKVVDFYNDDRYSSVRPGKHDCISIRDETGLKVYVQKRLVLMNLKELFELFRKENPDLKIGFSIFASLRPRHCILAGASGTHSICVCAMHQNIKLMMLGCNLKKLTEDTRYPLDHYNECIEFLICHSPTPQCYFRTCKKCPRVHVLHDFIENTLDENDIEVITYKQWISKPRTFLTTIVQTVDEFVDEFCDKMVALLPHTFVAKEQGNFLKTSKESLKEGEFLVICDFAENYEFIIQDAAPGYHWNNDQATVYTVVIYYNCNNVIEHKSLAIISDCLSHDSVAVYVHTKIIVQFIKSMNQNASKIIYFSDGAAQQYKNFKNFINLSYHQNDFGIAAEWHFFATAHGKGPCDGVGGSLKCAAGRASIRMRSDDQITTPRELYEWAAAHLPKINVFFSPKADYETATEVLVNRFRNYRKINDTRKTHCVIPQGIGLLKMKQFSRSEEFTIQRILNKL